MNEYTVRMMGAAQIAAAIACNSGNYSPIELCADDFAPDDDNPAFMWSQHEHGQYYQPTDRTRGELPPERPRLKLISTYEQRIARYGARLMDEVIKASDKILRNS